MNVNFICDKEGLLLIHPLVANHKIYIYDEEFTNITRKDWVEMKEFALGENNDNKCDSSYSSD